VVDDDLPEEDHDYRVELIVTPGRVIEGDRFRRPTGIGWAFPAPDQVAAIPALARRTRE
jgi:5-formyltetrahydrofolate cyclo-ligase